MCAEVTSVLWEASPTLVTAHRSEGDFGSTSTSTVLGHTLSLSPSEVVPALTQVPFSLGWCHARDACWRHRFTGSQGGIFSPDDVPSGYPEFPPHLKEFCTFPHSESAVRSPQDLGNSEFSAAQVLSLCLSLLDSVLQLQAKSCL